MSARSASRWVVVKFGGTSVSSLANWRNIALVVKRRLEAGHRVLVVHSAITKITDWSGETAGRGDRRANPTSPSRPSRTGTAS